MPAPAAAPEFARTALALLPLQAVLRAGEALLPLALAAWFGRTAETDLYYLLAAYFVFASAIVTGAFQDSGAVPVLIEVATADPGAFPQVAGALLGYTLDDRGLRRPRDGSGRRGRRRRRPPRCTPSPSSCPPPWRSDASPRACARSTSAS